VIVSTQTKTALEDALATHIADETDGDILTDWAMVCATTTLDSIGTGRTGYWIEGNPGQPVHVMVGLLRYGTEHTTFGDDDE
jgi:hypothetical protein